MVMAQFLRMVMAQFIRMVMAQFLRMVMAQFPAEYCIRDIQDGRVTTKNTSSMIVVPEEREYF